jgi:hypothetical protein
MIIKITELIKHLKDSQKRTDFVDITITKNGNIQIKELPKD